MERSNARQAILEAAAGLFIQHGYHGLAMRTIAEQVGVTKAALYYHFRDKEELFLALLSGYLEEMDAALKQIRAAGGSTYTQIGALVAHILSQPVEQRAMIRIASQESAELSPPGQQRLNRVYHEKFIDPLCQVLQNGMESGELRGGDPVVATWALLGILYPYFYPAHVRQTPSTPQVIAQILEIYWYGVAGEGTPG